MPIWHAFTIARVPSAQLARSSPELGARGLGSKRDGSVPDCRFASFGLAGVGGVEARLRLAAVVVIPFVTPFLFEAPVDGARGDAQQLGAQALVTTDVGQGGVDDRGARISPRGVPMAKVTLLPSVSPEPPLRTSAGRFSASMAGPRDRTTALSSAFSSWRTLPGQS